MVALPILDIVVTVRQLLSMNVSFMQSSGNVENENLVVGYMWLGECSEVSRAIS
jgi:hypothetical protein